MGLVESLTAPPDQVPKQSPFQQSFYQQKRPSYTYYAEHGIDRQRLQTAISQMSYDSHRTKAITNADFCIVSEIEAKQNNHGKSFVCGVTSPIFLLLTSGNVNLVEFGEIASWGSRDTGQNGQGFRSRIRIAVPGHNERTMLLDLIHAYPPELAKHVLLLPWHKDLVFGRDYDIFASLAVHPDPIFKFVCDQHFRTFRTGGHLLTMLTVNSGDYFVTDKEKKFYRRHPYYNKRLFNVIDSIRYYPTITRLGSQQFSWFVPAIGCNYLVLADPRVEIKTVERMLAWVAQRLLDPPGRYKDWGWPSDRPASEMTFPKASYNRINLPYHPGATSFYRAVGIEHEEDAATAKKKQKIEGVPILPGSDHMSMKLGYDDV